MFAFPTSVGTLTVKPDTSGSFKFEVCRIRQRQDLR